MLIQSCVPASFEEANTNNEDVHVSVLRSYKLQKTSLHKTIGNAAVVDDNSINEIQPCKLCNRSESVSNLLLCDRCEEGFHVSCCNPKVVLPIDEWFCHSCAKVAEDNDSSATMPSRGIGEGIGMCLFEFGPLLSPIAAMMKWPERFVSRVRIGEAYQAHLPDWAPLGEVNLDEGNCFRNANSQMKSHTASRKRKEHPSP